VPDGDGEGRLTNTSEPDQRHEAGDFEQTGDAPDHLLAPDQVYRRGQDDLGAAGPAGRAGAARGRGRPDPTARGGEEPVPVRPGQPERRGKKVHCGAMRSRGLTGLEVPQRADSDAGGLGELLLGEPGRSP
jgi:hypothetical protein